MDRLFLFSLLFTYLPVTESNGQKNCLTQPANEIEHKTGESVVLHCTVTADCDKGMRFEWFVFKEHNHQHLDLNSKPLKYILEEGSLHIKSLDVNDSGIYHCAAVWPGEPTQYRQYVGPGRTLLVRGPVKSMVGYILLWISFVLLIIYNLAIVSLIILKKFGCNRNIFRRLFKIDKNNSSKNSKKRTQFRDVLEEMYGKKNAARPKQIADKNKVEAASTELNESNDDIYQNV